jgi:hypothetical protein
MLNKKTTNQVGSIQINLSNQLSGRSDQMLKWLVFGLVS